MDTNFRQQTGGLGGQPGSAPRLEANWYNFRQQAGGLGGQPGSAPRLEANMYSVETSKRYSALQNQEN